MSIPAYRVLISKSLAAGVSKSSPKNTNSHGESGSAWNCWWSGNFMQVRLQSWNRLWGLALCDVNGSHELAVSDVECGAHKNKFVMSMVHQMARSAIYWETSDDRGISGESCGTLISRKIFSTTSKTTGKATLQECSDDNIDYKIRNYWDEIRNCFRCTITFPFHSDTFPSNSITFRKQHKDNFSDPSINLTSTFPFLIKLLSNLSLVYHINAPLTVQCSR